MKLNNVKVERFKNIERIDFDVNSVNILVGGNNSGKSTIIQAIHFAFTLLQSLNISNKWPAKGNKSSTISPSELIYIPSEDPYSLGFGGRLPENENKSILISFAFDTGDQLELAIRKGRITNIIVEPDNIPFGKTLSRLEAPYSVFSPGLAGVSKTENYVSDGVLLRALARGDANIVLRNILYRLHGKKEWTAFVDDLASVFPAVTLDVQFNPQIDQYIDVKSISSERTVVPLDLAGTGFLQATQILAYLHLFSPKLIVLDEPDSHLHPNNQGLLCSLLRTIALERDVQVIMTTHSRHVLNTLYNDAHVLWVHNGTVVRASIDDRVDILLELGALDVVEKLKTGDYQVVVLTEDSVVQYLNVLMRNSGFDPKRTMTLPYNGVTNVNLLTPLIKQIKRNSGSASVIVHRDRDFMTDDEVTEWKKHVRSGGGVPFVTSEIDVEDYFCTAEYLAFATTTQKIDVAELLAKAVEGQSDEILTSYINGRMDQERKAGTAGKLDIGKMSAEAAKCVQRDPWKYMKGKRKLARIRQVCQESYDFRFAIDYTADLPTDDDLSRMAAKYFKGVKAM
jgi:hypothetical protein